MNRSIFIIVQMILIAEMVISEVDYQRRTLLLLLKTIRVLAGLMIVELVVLDLWVAKMIKKRINQSQEV